MKKPLSGSEVVYNTCRTLVQLTLIDRVPRVVQTKRSARKTLCVKVREPPETKTKSPSVRRKPSRASSGHDAAGYSELVNACGVHVKPRYQGQRTMKQESHPFQGEGQRLPFDLRLLLGHPEHFDKVVYLHTLAEQAEADDGF